MRLRTRLITLLKYLATVLLNLASGSDLTLSSPPELGVSALNLRLKIKNEVTLCIHLQTPDLLYFLIKGSRPHSDALESEKSASDFRMI